MFFRHKKLKAATKQGSLKNISFGPCRHPSGANNLYIGKAFWKNPLHVKKFRICFAKILSFTMSICTKAHLNRPSLNSFKNSLLESM